MLCFDPDKRTKPLQILAVALAVLLGSVVAALSESREIRIVTQNFAPLQWENNGAPDGYVARYISAVFERVNEDFPVEIASFEFLPWKRAILTAKSAPNVMLFSMSRTPQREDQFLWLGEVSPYGQYLFQLNSKPRFVADTVEDLLDLDVKIGVQDGGNMYAYLKSLGFGSSGQLVPITDYRQGIEMLYLGRVDLLPLTGFLAEAAACKQGYDGSLLQPVVYIEDLAKPLWAVFSKGTDPDLADAFRREMVALKDSGYLEELTQMHRENWQIQACGQ
ncbi:ABC transporter substrate-binding protein [Roseibium sp. HPY-6]|uniref:substrate-binding periplasmic protein n=1 Tax=Roseibium sp. HPY-6 TaxID=3229852 RepID=UPI00338FC830